MPDHTHMIFTPNNGETLSRIMNGVKGSSSHFINAAVGRKSHLWIDESFDRIIRAGGLSEHAGRVAVAVAIVG